MSLNKKIPEKFERPWGHYENLLDSNGYKVKRIVVNPEQQLSLQYHHYRSEYWTCVEGDGYVTIGEQVLHAIAGRTYVIPLRERHRLRGGKNGITIIEVQIGTQCIEEDIVRLSDDYDRV